MVSKAREDRVAGVPNYVSIVDGGRDQIDVFSFGSAYLGPRTHPFTVVGDPSIANFQVKNLAPLPQLVGRFGDRMSLLERMDTLPPTLDASGTAEGIDVSRQRALQL